MPEMEIQIVREPIEQVRLEALARAWYGTMVKGVADLERGILALGGDWHIDANNVLIADGSDQKNLWGFNLYPAERGDAAIEYISLINIRPHQGNRDMELKDEVRRGRLREIIKSLIPYLSL